GLHLLRIEAAPPFLERIAARARQQARRLHVRRSLPKIPHSILAKSAAGREGGESSPARRVYSISYRSPRDQRVHEPARISTFLFMAIAEQEPRPKGGAAPRLR